MGCCSSSTAKIFCTRTKRPIIRLMTLGLDGAGKTSFVRYILKDTSNDLVPTIGFSSMDLKNYRSFGVQVYDTGGGKNIRDIWINYFAFAHGFIFVIDSSDLKRMDQVKEVLESVLANRKVQRKPLLVLINKQDIEGSLDDVEVCRAINLNALVNKYQCPTRVESCSLLNIWGNRIRDNPLLERGYSWILSYIRSNWTGLSERVEEESKEQIRMEEEVMRKRIEKYRNRQTEVQTQGSNGGEIEEKTDQNSVDDNSKKIESPDETEVEIVQQNESDNHESEKVIVERRMSQSEPKERTILIFGSLGQLDNIIEEDETEPRVDSMTTQLGLAPRPKSSYERTNRKSARVLFNRNRIAPLQLSRRCSQ